MNNIQEDKVRWDAMNTAADAGDIVAFFRMYAAYLERSNVISYGRSSLHKMSLAVVSALESTEHCHGKHT